MVLAELEVFHSRPIAPTRRVALGRLNLPVDPPPGYGGILLGGVAAAHIGSIDPELIPDVIRLTHQVERGERVAQPRLRYRLQQDRVGLQRSRARLIDDDGELTFEFAEVHGTPAQMLLAAIYAVGMLPAEVRVPVMAAVRRGIGWVGSIDATLIDALAAPTSGVHTLADPVGWALTVLGFGSDEGRGGTRKPGETVGRNGSRPSRSQVQGRFRDLLRVAHPDHGGDPSRAAQRIAELTEARRILLSR